MGKHSTSHSDMASLPMSHAGSLEYTASHLGSFLYFVILLEHVYMLKCLKHTLILSIWIYLYILFKAPSWNMPSLLWLVCDVGHLCKGSSQAVGGITWILACFLIIRYISLIILYMCYNPVGTLFKLIYFASYAYGMRCVFSNHPISPHYYFQS